MANYSLQDLQILSAGTLRSISALLFYSLSIYGNATISSLHRIFSTFDADVDDSIVNSGPFPQPLGFGEVYCELSATCWVDAVAWSPSGQSLAFASKILIYKLIIHI